MNSLVRMHYMNTNESWIVKLDNVLDGFKDVTIKHLGDRINEILAEGKALKAEAKKLRTKSRNSEAAAMEEKALGKDIEAEQMKLKIPMFNPAGYSKKNGDGNITENYTGIVLLELRNIKKENTAKLIKRIESIPSTYCCYGHIYDRNTIIILVKVDSSAEDHHEAYRQVAHFYQRELGIEIDDDPIRNSSISYWSYKPDLAINNDCDAFHVNLIEKPEAQFEDHNSKNQGGARL